MVELGVLAAQDYPEHTKNYNRRIHRMDEMLIYKIGMIVGIALILGGGGFALFLVKSGKWKKRY